MLEDQPRSCGDHAEKATVILANRGCNFGDSGRRETESASTSHRCNCHRRSSAMSSTSMTTSANHHHTSTSHRHRVTSFTSLCSQRSPHSLMLIVSLMFLSLTSTRLVDATLTPQNAALAEAVDNFWAWCLETFPDYAVKVGNQSYADRIGSVQPAIMDGWKMAAADLFHEVNNIMESDLEEGDALIKTLLEYHLQAFIDGHSFKKYGAYNNINVLEGPHTYFSSWVDNMNFSTVQAYHVYADKLEGFAEYVDEIKAGMEYSISEVTTLHEKSVSALESILSSLAVGIVRSPLAEPYKNILRNLQDANLPRTEWSPLSTEGVGNLFPDVHVPLNGLRDFIMERYLPECRPEVPVSSLTGGPDYYRSCLKWHLTSP